MHNGKMGWHTVGDLNTVESEESFYLYSSISSFLEEMKDETSEDNDSDIIFSNIRSMELDFPISPKYITVWSSKTQGYDYHYYLLAIACLLADCFPNAVTFGGDISASVDLIVCK